MSYDINILDPKTKEVIILDKPNTFKGGTYAVGNSYEAWLNITYNYSKFYYDTINNELGIRWIYNKTGKECLPVLEKAVAQLGTKQSDNYWEATPGNAGNALLGLIAFCKMCPNGVFDGD